MSGPDELAAAQRRLVEALVAGRPIPPGFDAVRVGVAARALLRKRAGEVARAWPGLAASYGSAWPGVFMEWAEGRPTRGSWLDGWDFARTRRASLDPAAALELAGCEARWAYDGESAPRPRRVALRRVPGGFVIQVFGRLLTAAR